MKLRRALTLAIVAAAACGGLECTLLPCFNGLSIILNRAPDAGTVVLVEAPALAPRTVDCDVEICWPRIHLADVFTDEVSVRVSSPTDTISGDYALNYTTTEPNGHGCGTCTSAELQIVIP